MKHSPFTLTLALVAGVGFASTASSQLLSRAGGAMIYDTDQDITWLADANYAATQYKQSCGKLGAADGKMEWAKASQWVKDLTYGGYSDWRLPKSEQPDVSCDGQNPVELGGFSFGFHCIGSELGHLFYGNADHGLGGKAGKSIAKTHNDNYRLFHNIAADIAGIYWHSTEWGAFPMIAYNFQTSDGFMNVNSKSVLIRVWPVRNGDVADAPIPSIDDDVKDQQSCPSATLINTGNLK